MAGGLSDLRAATRLAVDATRGVTDLVEAMHRAVSPIEGWTSSAAPGRTSGLTGLVYGSVRGVTRIVGSGLDLALGRLAPMVRESQRAPHGRTVAQALASSCSFVIVFQLRNVAVGASRCCVAAFITRLSRTPSGHQR